MIWIGLPERHLMACFKPMAAQQALYLLHACDRFSLKPYKYRELINPEIS